MKLIKKKIKDDPYIKTPILSPFRYSKTRHIRIADILVDEDEEESETDGYDCVGAFNMDGTIVRHLPTKDDIDDGFMAIQCSTPRRIISRWLSSLRRPKRKRCDAVRSQKREKEVARSNTTGDKSAHTTCSTNELNGGDDKESGVYVKDNGSFNLGVACGLIYLIVASKNELTKMAELRAEMETLLQNAKEELQSKNERYDAKTGLELNEINMTSSTTDLLQVSSSSSESRFSLQSDVVRDVCSEYVRNEGGEGGRDECVGDIDKLEAELEAELERLQVHLDSENDYSDSKTPGVRDSASASGHDVDISSFGELVDSHEAEPADYNEIPCDYGVPAIELERRLHELLESRQEERIKELEVALDYAKRKLHEKEIEVSWWKETATTALVSHQGPEASSSVASQHDSDNTSHLFR